MSVTTNHTEQKLQDLSDKDFRDLVEREIRKDVPSLTDADRQMLRVVSRKLREAENLGRWITTLEQIKASSETQLGARRDDLLKQHDEWVDHLGNVHRALTHSEYLAKKREFQAWRAANVRFLNRVQDRLLEARELRTRYFGAGYPTRAIQERNVASEAYMRLLSAIEMHRETTEGGEFQATEEDLALWGVITTEP